MKKLFTLVMIVAILAAVGAPTFAQGTCRTRSYQQQRSSRTYYDNNARVYDNNARVYYDYADRNRGRGFWDRHRDKITLGIGTGAGAAVGGLIGGKKGAVIGALSGLGGSALYTYKIRNRRVRY